ncbi:nucleotide exchange factor GrpE [Butyrivibrio sp. YAB3001]|uniref:nucleotide exchange factor GrpE n=1 Tax=Butyrivibrio sp. YAB3001 TaxID=1520812 RepID=UPI0008F68733|nr:nucleotide exchange factor GrpE [Butyrivibrio sp. YAB3001]SFC19336.1 molecular chaperone GrpE [Butyrivibrio sp. YAB3001]
MSNTDKKTVSEKDKEVLENIMEELEQEAKEKAEENAEKKEAEADVQAEEEKTEEAAENAEAKDTSEDEQSEENSDDQKESKKKPFFAKKDKKDPLKEKVDELNDRVMRQMAEFDNYRKRTDKEKAQMFEQGQSSILEKLLPVIDNFERGLAAVPEAEKDGAFADGMNKIYKQLITEMENLGVTPIEAVGKEFDPNLHNAVMQVESGDYEEGIIAQELQKGYKFHDTVLRHSMVAVAK